MPRLTIGKMMIGIAVSGLILGLGVYTTKPSRPKQVDRIDELVNPQEVLGWDSTGLILDNKKLTLPGMSTIPTRSRAMKIGTTRGIEVTPEGRVIGLVRVYHRSPCGNAPFINHLARVDLADMITVLARVRAAAPTVPGTSYTGASHKYDDALSDDEFEQIQARASTRSHAGTQASNSIVQRRRDPPMSDGSTGSNSP